MKRTANRRSLQKQIQVDLLALGDLHFSRTIQQGWKEQFIGASLDVPEDTRLR